MLIHPDEPYDLVYPISGGRLNTTPERSVEAIKSQLSAIWVHQINEVLGISRSDFGNYKVRYRMFTRAEIARALVGVL